MKDVHSQKKLDEMRKRLYDRGAVKQQQRRHQLTDINYDVARGWNEPDQEDNSTTDLRRSYSEEDLTSSTPESTPESEPPRRRRHYRSFVLIGSFLIFIFVAAVSSLYLYFGGNQISSQNIQLSISAPNSIGGGEVIPLQVAVANQNSVAIESATLIMKYPPGTRSTGQEERILTEERIPIDTLEPGEMQNIPIRVAVFGEENDQRDISATIEYRIAGSNGMFYKESSPHNFIITSSPIVLRVESVEKVASGQTVDVTLRLISNAASPIEDILVSASYPTGFTFQSSDPEPVFAQNVWRVNEILPEEQQTITLRGQVSGLTEETFRLNFSAGPTDPDNQFVMSSTLAEAGTEFFIERPFTDVTVAINGEEGDDIILSDGETAAVSIAIVNTLDETVYDMEVEVIPGGNSLSEQSVTGGDGFYDSNTNSIRWEVSNAPNFAVVSPGGRRNIGFRIDPIDDRTSSLFDVTVNVYARRVAETSATEDLIGTAVASGRYSSNVELASGVGRNVGRFGDAGPIPPEVGELTSYTITLSAEAGANDLTDAVVQTNLPIYVDWLDQYDAPGTVTYNSVAKTLRWDVGDIERRQSKELTFQVAIRPSLSQLGRIPTLLFRQSIQANDRFTGELLQSDAPAVSTELFGTELDSEEAGAVVR